ncbi:putative F-box/LRR-repeat protein isoform X2 [Tanacetum coccineum]
MGLIHRQQLNDVLLEELIQHIKLELLSQDAARTCILSKSWLHAWSTAPSIRLHCPTPSSSLKKNKNLRKYLRGIHLTLQRYHRHNLPIISFDLQLGLHTTNHPAARKLIKQAAITPSLKHLRITILAASFELPDKIFSNQNLNTLTLELITPYKNYNHSPYFRYPIVNNLRHLRVFEVCLGPDAWIDILEIHDAPSLRSLVFKTPMFMWDYPPSSFEIRTIGGSLTKLRLDNVHMDDAFSNMIKSNFPFLEELTLEIKSSSGEILDITSLTLRRLMLIFSPDEEIKVQVYAPNLLTYTHLSSTVPILLFTTTPPEQIELLFSLRISIDESFFLKLREALKLSSKFNIQMSGFRFGVSDLFNVDDVKTIVSHPATNVEQLLLKQHTNNNVSWENSLLLDAVFSICHPIYAKTNDQLRLRVAKYLLKLISKGVMGSCEIKNPLDGKCVALTSSSLSLLDTTNPHDFYEFKLSWCSP